MGKIIVIEGINGSGKETQSHLLVESLKEEGKKVVEFSFPMYESPTGDIFKTCVLGKNGESWFQEGYPMIDPYVVCLYTAADRKYNLKKIEQYLEDDYIVVLNRYTSSNMAHQGSKHENSEERFYMYQWIDKLEYWLLKLPKPDCTILLNMPPHYSSELKETQVSFPFYQEDYNEDRVLNAYLELSELYHWNVIDCIKNEKMKTIDEIHDEIMEIIHSL